MDEQKLGCWIVIMRLALVPNLTLSPDPNLLLLRRYAYQVCLSHFLGRNLYIFTVTNLSELIFTSLAYIWLI